jgi:hypothetical protein
LHSPPDNLSVFLVIMSFSLGKTLRTASIRSEISRRRSRNPPISRFFFTDGRIDVVDLGDVADADVGDLFGREIPDALFSGAHAVLEDLHHVYERLRECGLA